MMLEAGAHALNEKPHGLARDLDKALHAQHLMRRRDVRQTRDQTLGIAGWRKIDDETFEVVVVVIFLGVVTRRTIGEIALNCRAEAERDARIDGALSRAQNAGPPARAQHLHHPRFLFRVEQVPAAVKLTVEPEIEHTEVAVASMVKPTASPEVALAVTV